MDQKLLAQLDHTFQVIFGSKIVGIAWSYFSGQNSAKFCPNKRSLDPTPWLSQVSNQIFPCVLGKSYLQQNIPFLFFFEILKPGWYENFPQKKPRVPYIIINFWILEASIEKGVSFRLPACRSLKHQWTPGSGPLAWINPWNRPNPEASIQVQNYYITVLS